jgi:hypothetical protein
MEFTTFCGELMLVLDAYKGVFFGIQDKIGHCHEAFGKGLLRDEGSRINELILNQNIEKSMPNEANKNIIG